MYRQGPAIENDIAIFDNLEDMSVAPPRKTARLTYRPEYRTNSLIGRPGYPYETAIQFLIDARTGQPGNRLDDEMPGTENYFSVTIGSTWFDLTDYIKPEVQLPPSANLGVLDYDIIGTEFGMQKVTFVTPRRTDEITISEQIFDREKEVFVIEAEGSLESYAICDRHAYAKVPYCVQRIIIPPFVVKIRFPRTLMSSNRMILKHAASFVSCLIE